MTSSTLKSCQTLLNALSNRGLQRIRVLAENELKASEALGDASLVKVAGVIPDAFRLVRSVNYGEKEAALQSEWLTPLRAQIAQARLGNSTSASLPSLNWMSKELFDLPSELCSRIGELQQLEMWLKKKIQELDDPMSPTRDRMRVDGFRFALTFLQGELNEKENWILRSSQALVSKLSIEDFPSDS